MKLSTVLLVAAVGVGGYLYFTRKTAGTSKAGAGPGVPGTTGAGGNVVASGVGLISDLWGSVKSVASTLAAAPATDPNTNPFNSYRTNTTPAITPQPSQQDIATPMQTTSSQPSSFQDFLNGDSYTL